ncbi:MAG: hypothetical protein AABW88_04095 [Nanoarchaeota archaeon]
MGLFDFGKLNFGKAKMSPSRKSEIGKEKKKEVSKRKSKDSEFEVGHEGIVFNAKFQVLTKSREYAKKISNDYFENIKNNTDQKGNTKYFIIKKEIEPPRKLKSDELEGLPPESGKDVFMSVLSFDIGIKQKVSIFEFCFEYMPFFIEVTEPMNITFSANELSNYLSDIQATVHKIDEALKTYKLKFDELSGKYSTLSTNMVRMLRNNILLSLKEKAKTMKELSKNVGISEEQLLPFVDKMVADKEITLEKNKYRRSK